MTGLSFYKTHDKGVKINAGDDEYSEHLDPDRWRLALQQMGRILGIVPSGGVPYLHAQGVQVGIIRRPRLYIGDHQGNIHLSLIHIFPLVTLKRPPCIISVSRKLAGSSPSWSQVQPVPWWLKPPP